MPKRVELGKYSNSPLSQPIYYYLEYKKAEENSDIEQLDFLNPLRRRTIMGYVLPDFQRGLVWTQNQSVRFIESLWKGLSVGTYTVNIDNSYGNGNPHLRNILVDGQQRMWALQQYIEDYFPVFGLFYSELNDLEKRSFKNTTIWPCYETASNDEEYIRNYYNLMNFGGTAHKESERA